MGDLPHGIHHRGPRHVPCLDGDFARCLFRELASEVTHDVTLAVTPLVLEELFWCNPECTCGDFNKLGDSGNGTPR